jgi:hypothetical protein
MSSFTHLAIMSANLQTKKLENTEKPGSSGKKK